MRTGLNSLRKVNLINNQVPGFYLTILSVREAVFWSTIRKVTDLLSCKLLYAFSARVTRRPSKMISTSGCGPYPPHISAKVGHLVKDDCHAE
jgi:hypothetical protein